jgi:hypothetical protein
MYRIDVQLKFLLTQILKSDVFLKHAQAFSSEALTKANIFVKTSKKTTNAYKLKKPALKDLMPDIPQILKYFSLGFVAMYISFLPNAEKNPLRFF